MWVLFVFSPDALSAVTTPQSAVFSTEKQPLIREYIRGRATAIERKSTGSVWLTPFTVTDGDGTDEFPIVSNLDSYGVVTRPRLISIYIDGRM